MLFCPKCQQLEPTTPQKHDDGTVTYLCRKCGGVIPLRCELRPGEVVAGFQIEEEIGRGAMGIVYQAKQTNLDREVAIKILSDDSASDELYVERFFREARAAASLSHPNVVQAYDAGVTDDGIYYFVMEKITGENLEKVLNNVGPLNIPQALDVFISVANALSYAWTRNQLSHGDIKPENIIMRLNGKVKLADFGLARRAKDPELADEDIRATPAYAPPEIINGDKDVPGFKSDMYSFGATAYHILIGHEPFVGTDPMKVCAMQLSDIQTPLCELNPNIPQRLSDLVDALMMKDPADRPESWSDVVDELKSIRRDIAASASSSEDPSEQDLSDGDGTDFDSVPLTNRKILIAVVVAAAALLLVVIAAVVTFSLGVGSGGSGDVPPAPGSPSVSSGQSYASAVKSGSATLRDEAFYQARWKMIQEESRESGLELRQVEKFVRDAGSKAPAEAVSMLESLRAAETQSRALVLRNELLDQAAAFDPEEAKELDPDSLNKLCTSVMSKRDDLIKLDATLSEHVFLPKQKEQVDAYVKQLTNLRSAVSRGGENAVGTKTEPGKKDPATSKPAGTEPKQDDDDPAASTSGSREESTAGKVEDSKLSLNYALLLDFLPNTIEDESERADALRMLNELLADKAFTDEIPRKNCLGVRKFLVLNQQSLLPYLVADESALRGMKLFPNTYPDSILDDISESTFRLKVPDQKASIIQKVSWSKLRKDEGEDRIIVTLINSPQLAKLSEEFRESLFVRAIFLGVDPEMLRKRFERASGLPAGKVEELARIAGFFQEPEIDDEEEED